MSATAPRVLFQELQRFTQAFLWIPLTLLTSFVSGTTLWMIMRQVVNGIPFGDPAISNELLLGLGSAVITVNALILLFFATARMQTEVTTRGLFVRFFPFHRKTRQISLDDVESVSVVIYRALIQYGGYGIRRYPKATAYCVRGLEGVRLDYANGVHVLIGSQDAEALFHAIQTVLEERAERPGDES
jgi:hypothetical protein